MMLLKDIFKGSTVVSWTGPKEVGIESLTFDSRTADAGTLFFALPGTSVDGHDFITAAVEKGASAIVCERLPEDTADGVAYIVVEDAHAVLGMAASAFYDNPSAKLRLVGITGTNGKTTTATLLFDMFRALGYKCGLISTVVYRIENRSMVSTHTTPDPIRLNAMLAEMVEAGCEYCFMEVSSHSIVQERIAGLTFEGGVFTNITHDHLDYHGTFAEYIRAKKMFFDRLPKKAFALVNTDDRNGSVMVQNTKAAIKSYGMQGRPDFGVRIMEMHMHGMLLSIDGSEIWVKFIGRFNAYNLLAVYATARILGAEKGEVLTAMSALDPVDGRFQTIRSASGVTAIVDYAHTPDALQKAIDTINEIRTPGQKLYVLAGCGGDRDRTKRPVMGRIAAAGGDLAILTSDNPRSEDPAAIIEEMKADMEPGAKYLSICDRREAIKTAVMMASPGDIILVAGKGHETYQIIAGVKHHFDDREELAAAFAAKEGK